jgi:hypothetical protein
VDNSFFPSVLFQVISVVKLRGKKGAQERTTLRSTHISLGNIPCEHFIL